MSYCPQLFQSISSELHEHSPVLIARLQRRECGIIYEEGKRSPIILLAHKHASTKTQTRYLPTFLTPSRISQIELLASSPGMRSPMAKGKDTPEEARTEVVIDLR